MPAPRFRVPKDDPALSQYKDQLRKNATLAYPDIQPATSNSPNFLMTIYRAVGRAEPAGRSVANHARVRQITSQRDLLQRAADQARYIASRERSSPLWFRYHPAIGAATLNTFSKGQDWGQLAAIAHERGRVRGPIIGNDPAAQATLERYSKVVNAAQSAVVIAASRAPSPATLGALAVVEALDFGINAAQVTAEFQNAADRIAGGTVAEDAPPVLTTPSPYNVPGPNASGAAQTSISETSSTASQYEESE